MVLLWGLIDDGPMAAVMRQLEQSGTPFVFIDQRRSPEYLFVRKANGMVGGKISGANCSFDLDEMQSAYIRPYSVSDLDIFSDVDPSSAMWKRTVEFEQSMFSWCELTPCRVVNRPSNMSSNSSKPFQLDIIRGAGFLVPETLITTDPKAVAEFKAKYKRVIYKSISSWRSVVSQLTEEDLARAKDVECCPTQFQRFIEGTDYRIHVLSNRVFTHRIRCTDDDYRYSTKVSIERVTLDDELERRCVKLTMSLGLAFTGIDVRQSVDGTWYCFEVNPSPGFTYFDGAAGSISCALAEYLAVVN